MSDHPHFGFTRHGLAVHASTADHHPDGTAYKRFNKAVALWLTNNVGTMTCFWIVLALCVSVLPSVLFAMAVIPRHWGILPAFLTGFGFELMMTWIVSTCFQALCLPAIIVGQNIQNEAADARAAKSFEDTEVIVDRLDLDTKGGLGDVMAELRGIRELLAPPAPQKAVKR